MNVIKAGTGCFKISDSRTNFTGWNWEKNDCETFRCAEVKGAFITFDVVEKNELKALAIFVSAEPKAVVLYL